MLELHSYVSQAVPPSNLDVVPRLATHSATLRAQPCAEVLGRNTYLSNGQPSVNTNPNVTRTPNLGAYACTVLLPTTATLIAGRVYAPEESPAIFLSRQVRVVIPSAHRESYMCLHVHINLRNKSSQR